MFLLPPAYCGAIQANIFDGKSDGKNLLSLPPQLRDNATVYVLNPDKGFEVARKGTNGFHAFVARTGDDAMQGAWPLTKYPEDILYPISFDSAGAKANMRGFFDIAAMQAKGTQPESLKRLIQERYKTGHYKAPERAACSYMLSPILRTYVNPDASDNIVTASVPHVMCYAPNVSTTEIGVMPTAEQLRDFTQHGAWMQTPAPFVIHHGPHGYLVHIGGVAEREAIDKEDEAKLVNTTSPVFCKRQSISLPRRHRSSEYGRRPQLGRIYPEIVSTAMRANTRVCRLTLSRRRPLARRIRRRQRFPSRELSPGEAWSFAVKSSRVIPC